MLSVGVEGLGAAVNRQTKHSKRRQTENSKQKIRFFLFRFHSNHAHDMNRRRILSEPEKWIPVSISDVIVELNVKCPFRQ